MPISMDVAEISCNPKGRFQPGTKVRTTGLKNKPENNDREARVVEFNEEKMRYVIEWLAGGTSNLKPENLVELQQVQQKRARSKSGKRQMPQPRSKAAKAARAAEENEANERKKEAKKQKTEKKGSPSPSVSKTPAENTEARKGGRSSRSRSQSGGKKQGGRSRSRSRRRAPEETQPSGKAAAASASAPSGIVISAQRMIQISKALSLILRHKAVELRLSIQPDGYVPLEEVLKLDILRNLQVTREEIECATRDNEKKRFQMSTAGGQAMIRAVQGHSMKVVQDDHLLVRFGANQQLPAKCVHGTYSRHWTSIREQGLIAGGMKTQGLDRNHIHFAPYDYNDKRVISGMRPGCDLAIYINMSRAMNDGIAFFMSQNEVILSPGENGILHRKYFKSVKNIVTGEILYEGGE